MTKVNVEYNKDTLELVNELAEKINANNTVQFEREGDQVTIKACDVAESVVYIFKADKSHFDFDEDMCTFYNFPEFYNLLKSFGSPEIIQEGQTLTIKENRSRIKYQLSDDDIIDEDEKIEDVDWDSSDIVLDLTQDNISKISKMSNAIEADKVKLVVKDEQLTIKLFNNKHDNTYEDVFDVTNPQDLNLELVLEKDLFNKIPLGDYTVNINEDLLVQFVLKNVEGFTIEIYASQMSED